jgi:transcription elongation factor GreA
MVSGSTVALTAAGMQQLADDLRAFRERRAALTEAYAASPEDAGSDLQTGLVLADLRIAEIESVLARAQPLDRADREPGVVAVGSRVTLHWEEDGTETYTIVDPAEVAPTAGRISYESPVGAALLDRHAGERVAVETIAGSAWLEILEVD